jgi:glyoxylase-like metal-dependent hydrolase (beta-lactamase superfamily II)
LKVERLIVGVLKTNCYVVKGGDEGFIIDPGGSPDAIISHVLRRRLTVRLILVTHGHPDHYSAYLDVKEALGCKVVMHELDLETASLMGMPIEPDVYVDEGSTIEIRGLRFRVLHTPGHSPGSISLLGYGLIFTGDLMFKMGYGRTDLPGGSYTTLMRSLNRILSLEGDLKVYPGHGPTINLRDEKDFYKTFAI